MLTNLMSMLYFFRKGNINTAESLQKTEINLLADEKGLSGLYIYTFTFILMLEGRASMQ